MAITRIGLNDPNAVKLWSRSLSEEISKATMITPLISKNKDNIIQLLDNTQKGPGDQITFSLQPKLVGYGMTDDSTLEGNEEGIQYLTDHVRIDTIRHATRVANDDTIDQQRLSWSLRSTAREALSTWFADRFSNMFFVHVCGYTAAKQDIDGRADREVLNVVYGHNTPKAPSDKRIVRPENKTKDEDLTDKAKHSFNINLIDQAVTIAKTANPMVAPLVVGGDRYYVMYLHPYQVMQLRTNTNPGQWLDIQKYAHVSDTKNNPIFSGALGVYNGVILREAQHVTVGVHSTTNAPVPSVRRAVLLGKQAAVIAFGRGFGGTRYSWVEDEFDYKKDYGLGVRTIVGMKKTIFTAKDGDGTPQDFGTIVVPTMSDGKF